MLIAPDIDPVALRVGPVEVHWYGLMYLAGFLAFWYFGSRQARLPGSDWTKEQVADLLFYCAIGVILGGRLGYVLIYNAGYFLSNPLELLQIWRGGMSFHGGFLGVAVAMAWFARRQGKTFLEVADFVAPWAPLGLLAGRIGNFINQELWGRVTDVPWGIVFAAPEAGGLPRHPSQIYEAVLEGVALFVLLQLWRRRRPGVGALAGLFCLGYGVFRFLVEFTREPDAHLGLIFGPFSMGQVLSVPMLLLGVWLMARARSSVSPPPGSRSATAGRPVPR